MVNAVRLQRRTRTGAVLGLVIVLGIVAALAILYAFEQGLHQAVVITVADAVLAVAIVVWLRLRRREIVVGDRGIEVRGAFVKTSLAWDDVSHYFYWSTNEEGLAVARELQPRSCGDLRQRGARPSVRCPGDRGALGNADRDRPAVCRLRAAARRGLRAAARATAPPPRVTTRRSR